MAEVFRRRNVGPFAQPAAVVALTLLRMQLTWSAQQTERHGRSRHEYP